MCRLSILICLLLMGCDTPYHSPHQPYSDYPTIAEFKTDCKISLARDQRDANAFRRSLCSGTIMGLWAGIEIAREFLEIPEENAALEDGLAIAANRIDAHRCQQSTKAGYNRNDHPVDDRQLAEDYLAHIENTPNDYAGERINQPVIVDLPAFMFASRHRCTLLP